MEIKIIRGYLQDVGLYTDKINDTGRDVLEEDRV